MSYSEDAEDRHSKGFSELQTRADLVDLAAISANKSAPHL